MKRNKKLFVLLGVLLAVCVATFVVTHVEQRKEDMKSLGDVILAVPAENVRSLTWSYDNESFSFHKNGNWSYDGDTAFPVDDTKIEKLLSIFEKFGAQFMIENVDDMKQYGLTEPTCTVRFSTDKNDYEMKMGVLSTMDSQRYVSIGDGNVYLVKDDPFDTFNVDLQAVVLSDETPTLKDVTRIEFRGDTNYTITYDPDCRISCCDKDVYFTKRNNKTVPLDTFAVQSYASVITSLKLTEFASYDVTPAELAAWGLDKPELSVTVDYSEYDDKKNATPATFTLEIGRNQEELAAKKAAEAAGGEYTGNVTAYCRVAGSPLVYVLDKAKYKSLSAASYNDLRHAEVLTADYETVNKIDFTLDGTVYSFASVAADEDDDEKFTAVLNGAETDFSDISKKIKGLKISEFTDENKSSKKEMSILFHLNNENHPSVKVDICRLDGSRCLVIVDGDVTGYISRATAMALVESVYSIVLG